MVDVIDHILFQFNIVQQARGLSMLLLLGHVTVKISFYSGDVAD